ncbi:MAG: hypothetical protein WAN13_00975 [Candidatus Acidiferrales bacterium]|jgi:hypothetical protein
MLGELLGENSGRRVVRRVIEVNPPTVEVSFEETGKWLGIATTGLGTYTSVIRPDGTFFGEGQGLIITADGEGVTWKGSGQGKPNQGGSISYRGILYFQTTSQKLARLNTAPGVFEYEIDPEGKTRTKVWEWK